MGSVFFKLHLFNQYLIKPYANKKPKKLAYDNSDGFHDSLDAYSYKAL
jgi:hypothetical protein